MTFKALATDDTAKQDGSDTWLLDPLDEDGVDEEALPIGRRALIRIALVASEAGARFQREGLSQDPTVWMLSPLAMFAGQPPIEACMTLNGCARAVLVHGLGLDLDASAEAINALMSSGEDIPPAVIANCASSMDFPLNVKKQPATAALG